MKHGVLFPCDDNKIINDKELKKEYEVAKASNLFDVHIFNYNDWKENEVIDLVDVYNESNNITIYRGYMMKESEYSNFYYSLMKSNVYLITNPFEYKTLHIFKNIYKMIESDTAKTLFYSFDDKISIDEIKTYFDRFLIKDYVKSLKYKSFPKCFESRISQNELDYYVNQFKEMRGNLLTGGICIKEFLDLKMYDGKINEYRVFYMNKEIISISKNSGQGDYTNVPPKYLLEKYSNLPSPYYTVDFAELENGAFKIIEVGDGQVSGLSDNQNYESYYRALNYCIN